MWWGSGSATADWPGAAEFMCTVGELACGADKIWPPPTMGRDAIPDLAGEHSGFQRREGSNR